MDGKVLAVWGSPSSGKTSLCAVLSKVMAKKNKSVMLLSTDSFIPAFSLWLPFVEAKGSIGSVLTCVNLSESSVASKVTLHPKYNNIGILAMCSDESCVTYPSIEKENTEMLLSIIRGLCDIVIVDCSSFFIYDMLTLSALELADYVIRLHTADTRGALFVSSQLRVLDENVFNSTKHIRVCNSVKEYHPVDEVANSVGGFDFLLPFNEELESKYMTGKLFEDFYTPRGREYAKSCGNIAAMLRGGLQ